MNVQIKRLNDEAVIPKYAHEGDAGFDLVAVEDIMVEPGQTVKVPTGLAFAIPNGYELQIRPRSGLTLNTKLRVQLGTVDSTYRGEVAVIVDNAVMPSFYYNEEYRTIGLEYDYKAKYLDGTLAWDEDGWQHNTYFIRKGDRIAQGVIAPIVQAKFDEVDTLDETIRGEGGFGSTGVIE